MKRIVNRSKRTIILDAGIIKPLKSEVFSYLSDRDIKKLNVLKNMNLVSIYDYEPDGKYTPIDGSELFLAKSDNVAIDEPVEEVATEEVVEESKPKRKRKSKTETESE